MEELFVTSEELAAVASKRKRAIARPLDPRYAAGDLLMLRVLDPETQKPAVTLFAHVTYVDRLDDDRLCILSIDPRATSGAGFRFDGER